MTLVGKKKLADAMVKLTRKINKTFEKIAIFLSLIKKVESNL